ncbi:phosphodiester glycosidase family protein [Nocardioides sp. zg-DK7169]|uniref:phosphodiester glycosidase family protein n=1 Tax=Nocardioides sp. zg-DK7169 TaxID=2736600 RepID=UPI001551FEF8|nr:phosphodiester glycosidase family protein [Nocardioides sp. zg-DK7169]NPC97464.1 phosphodiester glycosidase family protein [Nocardioides sp. zg-DK7169]
MSRRHRRGAHPRQHRLRTLLPALVASACLVLTTLPGSATAGATPTATATASAGDTHALPRHSSDGVVGPRAPQVPRSLRTEPVRSEPVVERLAPGVRLTTWSQTDARGRVAASLLSVKWRNPRVRLDYAGPGPVASTSPVSELLARRGALAGVNGDFFDIGRTGAPLGVGRPADAGVRHAPRSGWNSAFYLDARGVPRIGTVPLRARIPQRPAWAVTNVNSPRVAAGGIGVYTPAWGPTSGHRVTGGQRRNVRVVELRQGRVVANRTVLSANQPIRGRLLVGRGAGAKRLATLRPGQRIDVRWHLAGRPRLAIGGNKVLLQGGRTQVVDDVEMHPRTAVGIDRDTRELLLLVVDGRQDGHSRGLTMVELAAMMTELGAEAALNLDGGGSSTLAVTRTPGLYDVANRPSDGAERRVANALAVLSVPAP